MIHGEKALGLILARGGSKGLPGKNIRPLRGKPLVAWTVEVAKQSKYLDAVVISTDSSDIARAAEAAGAEVPFLRPAELASDTATSIDAILHALSFLQAQNRHYDYLVLLEPTSPLREVSDIDDALDTLAASKALSIVSVCQATTIHPAFMYFMGEGGALRPFLPDAAVGLRRQDTSPVFFLEGTVYAARTSSIAERRSFYHDQTIGFEVPKWKSLEIDDEIDFLHVEAVMKHRGIGQ